MNNINTRSKILHSNIILKVMDIPLFIVRTKKILALSINDVTKFNKILIKDNIHINQIYNIAKILSKNLVCYCKLYLHSICNSIIFHKTLIKDK